MSGSLIDAYINPRAPQAQIARFRCDPARLVGAYTLALAAAFENGLHPGVVILDEPLQQNPDTAHIKLFLDFLSKDLAKEAKIQTLVFTFLNEDEDRVQKLRDSGTTVITVEGHLLGKLPQSEPNKSDSGS